MDTKDSIEITETNLPESNSDEETKVDEPIVNNGTGETETEFLKQGAVKAIIWEDIVAKGYDTVDFAQFLGTFQLGFVSFLFISQLH